MAKKAAQRQNAWHNEYRCCVEINQNDKYCVRIQARFKRRDWVLPVYFLASSFDRALRKLEQSVQYLQQQEDRLWFWGVDRTDDPNVSAEMLQEAGLRLDRRGEFPRHTERLAVAPDQRVPTVLLAPMRQRLANSVQFEAR
jgi:hypothetical protein